jgi:hypothetical protein
MLIPNNIMMAAHAQAIGKEAKSVKIGKPTHEDRKWLQDHASDWEREGNWEKHTIPASTIPRHFLDIPIPDPFYVYVKSPLA